MRTNRTCKICGKAYYYCVSCDEAQRGLQGYEPWHILVDDNNCFRIFTTLQNHSTKAITDDMAREILSSCDLSVLENARDNIKEQVNSIMATGISKEEPVAEEETEIKPVRRTRTKKVNVEN